MTSPFTRKPTMPMAMNMGWSWSFTGSDPPMQPQNSSAASFPISPQCSELTAH
jgi:hypothetical protein